MKTIKQLKAILLLAICLSVSSVFAQPSTTPAWTAFYNNTLVTANDDYGRAVTTDGGIVYITGGANYGGGNDYYITTIKYNNSGSATWTRTVNIANGTACPVESGFAIAVDGSGNVWVAATLQETGGTYSDLVLLKYNSAGTLQTNYPKRFASTACGGNGAGGLCLTISGSDVYVGGSKYDGTANSWYFSVVKNNPSGSGWSWNYTYNSGVTGGTHEHRATDVKVNANGVYATGWIYKTNSSVTTKDIFTVGLNTSTGAVIAGSSWPQTYNGSANGDDATNALSLDASGNVYIAGYATRTSTGKDGYLMKYDKSGVAAGGNFPVFYDYQDAADAWSDMEVIGTSTTAPAVYVGGYRTSSSANVDYDLAAYTSAGDFANGGSYWNTADPVHYDGAKTGTEAAGTDYGYAIEYSATTNRIYISGMADEGTSAHNINITTVGYDATTGASAWGPANYDMNTDATPNGADEAYWKYALKVYYSGCYTTDIILVEGASIITNHGFDFVTIEYGATGQCSQSPAPRMMNSSTSSNENAGFYPNPFSTTAELILDPKTKVTNATLLISDITGRVVATVPNISSTNIMVGKGNLPNGLYFFKVSQEGVLLSNGKFVITD